MNAELSRARRRKVRIGIVGDEVGAEDEQHVELTGGCGLEHRAGIQPRLRNRLVPGLERRKHTHVDHPLRTRVRWADEQPCIAVAHESRARPRDRRSRRCRAKPAPSRRPRCRSDRRSTSARSSSDRTTLVAKRSSEMRRGETTDRAWHRARAPLHGGGGYRTGSVSFGSGPIHTIVPADSRSLICRGRPRHRCDLENALVRRPGVLDARVDVRRLQHLPGRACRWRTRPRSSGGLRR